MQREYKRHGFFCFAPQDSVTQEIRCLKPGESGINTICRVLEVATKKIRGKEGQQKVVLTGVIADHTAKLPFVSWQHARVVQNSVVQIENAYVKRWKGLPTLYIGKNTHLHEQDIEFPGYAELSKPKKRTLKDIVGCGGAFDVMIEGDVVSSVAKGNRWVLDDGTGAVFMDIGEAGVDISFGTPVKTRGDVVVVEESEYEYVLIAEKVKVIGDELVIRTLRQFLSRYT